ncbi:hypothetical protein LWI28_013032 [Acer negundo]|uniref:Uncharacterized protein n=1 Tax=Acer negundo TaxID=4023 RepID=A0AAD5IEV8_ACENE|nr:hypothetical protein LWI28_013032 [Acer negundo]
MGNNNSKKLWEVIRDLFATHNRSNIVYYKKELRQAQKGGMKINEYLNTMKSIVDNLALAGHPVTGSDLISLVLYGLDSNEYNPIVCQLYAMSSLLSLLLILCL